jgi:histidinol-phosphate aminotransferase
MSVYQPGRPIEEVARELHLPPEDIIKLASNENPLGPSPRAVAAIHEALAGIQLYPDGNAFYLKEKLAAKLRVQPTNLIVGNGSNEIIEFAGHVLLSPNSWESGGAMEKPEVVVSQYCFAVYPLVTKLFGANLVTVPARNYGHDLSAILRAISPRTRLVFVANPNNPTGTTVPPAELKKFVSEVPDTVLLVLDEAYIDFLEDAADFLPLIRAGKKPNLLLMRTFSKIFGLAGLRVGYGVGHPELIAAFEKVRQPFNLNSLAQAAALGALEDAEHVHKTKLNNAAGLEFFAAAFHRLKLEFIPSAANFILVRVGDGQRLFEQLQARGIIVRPMGGYQLSDWIRISIGTPPQNQRCLGALQTALGK